MRPTTPPLRWDPEWPAARPITEHPDFPANADDDPEELRLFREYGPSPMCGSLHPIEQGLALSPRMMIAHTPDRVRAVVVDFVNDLTAAGVDDDARTVGLAIARTLLEHPEVLRLERVAALVGCTRLDAHRAIAELARRGLLVEIGLVDDYRSSHVMLVSDGIARLSAIYDRGTGFERESDEQQDAEDREAAGEDGRP